MPPARQLIRSLPTLGLRSRSLAAVPGVAVSETVPRAVVPHSTVTLSPRLRNRFRLGSFVVNDDGPPSGGGFVVTVIVTVELPVSEPSDTVAFTV